MQNSYVHYYTVAIYIFVYTSIATYIFACNYNLIGMLASYTYVRKNKYNMDIKYPYT